jgi:phosphoribosylanthranilate isomerase
MKRPWIKFCGLTRPADVRTAVQTGADLIGLNFSTDSPRAVSFGLGRTLCDIAHATPISQGRRKVRTVAVFVNPDDDLVMDVLHHVEPDILQFHGDESPTFCRSFKHPFFKAHQLRSSANARQIPDYLGDYAAGYLIDSYSTQQRGGTGRRLDLSLAKASLTSERGFLAGGLTADNIEEIITTVEPFGVDVASGIEERPGIKSPKMMAAFIAAVNRACAA